MNLHGWHDLDLDKYDRIDHTQEEWVLWDAAVSCFFAALLAAVFVWSVVSILSPIVAQLMAHTARLL